MATLGIQPLERKEEKVSLPADTDEREKSVQRNHADCGQRPQIFDAISEHSRDGIKKGPNITKQKVSERALSNPPNPTIPVP
jgi:hypothetical protein